MRGVVTRKIVEGLTELITAGQEKPALLDLQEVGLCLQSRDTSRQCPQQSQQPLVLTIVAAQPPGRSSSELESERLREGNGVLPINLSSF
jgi:hypothetical protein